MASPIPDWIGAASCCEGPRPAATFADLPRKEKREMLRFACAAMLSTVFFAGIAVLSQPIASRSLAAYTRLPNAPVTSDQLPRVRLAGSFDAAPRSVVRPRALRQSPATRLASVRESSEDDVETPSAPPAPPRRGNVFSRFFRTVLHGVQPSPAKADVP